MNSIFKKVSVLFILLMVIILTLTSAYAGSTYSSNFTSDSNSTNTTILGLILANLTLSPVNWSEINQSIGNGSGIVTVKLNNTGNNSLIQPFCIAYTSLQSISNITCFSTSGAISTPILSPSTVVSGCTGSLNGSDCYEELVRSKYASGNVTQIVNGKLWVPWFSSSTACSMQPGGNLQNGSNCNFDGVGTTNATVNCMVTDEFSQVGVLVSLSQNQTKMNQFTSMVQSINSTFGQIPAWRIFKNVSTIDQCRSGINSNCDTASDATARIIIAEFNAANNSYFTDQVNKTLSYNLAINLTRDSLLYEYIPTCFNSTLGNGPICYWMGAGAQSVASGMGTTDYGYTGYYADGTIAYLEACASTGNLTYCAVAGNISQQFLLAAHYDGLHFRVPPGRSFKWTNITGGSTLPNASCTNTCSPDQWDTADAVRAFGMCQAMKYGQTIGITLPNMTSYCNLWDITYMETLNSIPIQFYANFTNSSTPSASNQSGYLAQGLQALALQGSNSSNFATVLNNCLAHYSSTTGTWDSTTCDGVYNEAFCERALGTGIGRDLNSFPTVNTTTCSVPFPVLYSNGGLQVTLQQPANNTNVTTNYAYINLTVQNFNTTTVTSNGSGMIIIASCNMTSSADSCGASGGTLNLTDNTYNVIEASQTFTFGPFNQTQHTYINISFAQFEQNASSGATKFYPEENTSSTATSPHIIDDISGNLLRFREENSTGGGFTKTLTAANNTWIYPQIIINRTASKLYYYNATANFTVNITFLNNVSADYFRISIGTSGGMFKITNITATVPGSEVIVSSTAGNSSLNVSIYNASNSLLIQINNTANNSNISYNWTGLSNGIYPYKVNLKSYNGEDRNFSFSVNVSLQNLLTTQNFCTATGNVTLVNVANNSAINVSIINITDGTSYWVTNLNNYYLLNLNSSYSNKTLQLKTYVQGQNNTYVSKYYLLNSTQSFVPTITYGNSSGQNNISLDIACDGSTYQTNVTSGQSYTCPVIGSTLIYRLTFNRDSNNSPTLTSVAIVTTDVSSAPSGGGGGGAPTVIVANSTTNVSVQPVIEPTVEKASSVVDNAKEYFIKLWYNTHAFYIIAVILGLFILLVLIDLNGGFS